MERNIVISEMNQKQPKSGRGGARPGSGRPKGSRDRVSILSLLETLEQKANGQSYEELLVEDFLNARAEGDRQTVMKYHHMMMNKLIADKNEVTIQDSEDTIELRRRAFMEAITTLSRRDTI